MIIDYLDNAALYKEVHPLFKKVFNYLTSVDLEKLANGKIELEEDRLFLIISDSTLKSKEEAKLEVHNKYIDIQIPLSKAETFGVAPRKNLLNEVDVFNKDKDIQFFTDKATSFITLEPQQFIVFFPQDAHAPCIGEGSVKKIVVKVLL